MGDHLLDIERLRVAFSTEEGIVQAVDDVSLTLDRGEVLAVVGESGSGKSVTAMTLLGLTRSPNARFEGSARLEGVELLDAPEDELRRMVGAICHEPFYETGTWSDETMGVYVGWAVRTAPSARTMPKRSSRCRTGS